MAYAATLHIAADRYTPCVRVLTVKGLDLRSPGLRMQVRLSPDTPGAPMIDLGAVDNPRAEGLALLSVETVDGLVTSIVQIRINESTMKRLPFSGEPGDATPLQYDMIAVVSGDKRVLARGAFTVDAGVTGADAAPSDRPYGYGSSRSATGIRSGAVLTFGDERVTITVDGADLVAPIARRAEDAANRAEADRASTAAERQAAEAARDEAEVSRDIATTNAPTYTSQAAGEAATPVGEMFAVVVDGAASMRRRTGGGSDFIYEFQTSRFTSTRGGPAIRRLLRDRIGETASIADYVVGRGDVDDTDAYDEAMSLGVREWIYPEDCTIHLSRQVKLRSNMRHVAARGSRIIADVDDFGLFGVGLTTGNLVQVLSPTVRYTWTINANLIDAEPLTPGDMIIIADIATDDVEPNVVQSIRDGVIYLRYFINKAMSSPATIRIYKVYAPLENIHFDGPISIRNVNNGSFAGGVRFNTARNITMRETEIERTGYQGIVFENALNFMAFSPRISNTKGVAIGARAAKDFTFSDVYATDVQADESITFYKNVCQGIVDRARVKQYLFGSDPQGGTAGNNILLDELCARILISNPICEGSATYSIFLNNGSEYCQVTGFNLARSNVGGIRVANNCHKNRICSGAITDVVDPVHPSVDYGAQNGQPTAGVIIDADCSGNIVEADRIQFDRIASGINVRDLQPA